MKVRVKVPEEFIIGSGKTEINSEISSKMASEADTPQKGYYSDRFKGMSDKALDALKECYKTRKRELHEQDTDNYAKFLKETEHAYADEGLKGFRTMAACYYTYSKGKKGGDELTCKSEWPVNKAEDEIGRFTRGLY